MMKQHNILVLLVILTVVFVSNVGAEGEVYKASLADDGIQRIEIEGGEFYFKPNHVKVKINVPVELVVKKTEGFTPHNIIVKAKDAGIEFKEDIGGEAIRIKFTPTKAGKYEMYCDEQFLFFENHREKGMKGFIEVVL